LYEAIIVLINSSRQIISFPSKVFQIKLDQISTSDDLELRYALASWGSEQNMIVASWLSVRKQHF